MNKRKKASYGMKKMRGGDYMEPNKELKFGAAKGTKPKRKKAKDGTDKPKGSAAAADNVRGAISGARGAADSLRNRVNSALGRNNKSSGAARRKELQEKTTRNSPNPPAGTDPKKGTPVGSKKANPYSAAKKKDANLDSYIKARNAAKKGSNEYNDAQNKINKAYGKGPTDRKTTDGPATRGKDMAKKVVRKTAPVSSGAAKPTLKTNMTSTKAPAAKATTKKESRQTGRAAMKDRRQSARSNKAEARKSERADNQQSRADKRDSKQFDRNEKKGAKADRKNKLADIRANKKSELKAARAKAKMGGPRRKAVTGMLMQGAGAGAQFLGKGVDAIAGKETKFGKIADAAGSAAVTAGGFMGGVPGAQNLVEGAKGIVPPAGGTADTNQQTDPNAPKPMRRGGKKKGKKGMMKYKAGGAKPDFPDLDKDGNKTEPIKKALKDRRSKAKMGKKR